MSGVLGVGGIVDVSRASGIYDALRLKRPLTKVDLRYYVETFLGIDVPDGGVCREHDSPMDYLWHAFSCDGDDSRTNGDAVVWANRGGGKTELAAIATLLDCVFKDRCSVRILGGSLDQSSRMYEYLTDFVHRGFEGRLDGPMRKGKCRFVNGSSVEVLAQSARSVRGRHVHKLRCDEVELFDERVFEAAGFITQSTDGITAAMESISTMHRPYGLMSKLIGRAADDGTAMFKWCVWDVIERCVERSCSQCALSGDCRGRAKQGKGYLKIDDCITQMKRSSRAGFEAEMLCERPNLENAVFGEFDPEVHVGSVGYDGDLALYRAIDFGFVNPFVCLWIQVDGEGGVRVIDEYVRRRAAIDVHGEAVKGRTPCDESAVAGTFCDPAGAGRNDVTGTSAVKELRAMGLRVRYKKSFISEGVELIRRALRRGDGQSRLVIDPKCAGLIEAMRCYHYPDSNRGDNSEVPLKDGVHDHYVDALRYFFVNVSSFGKASSRRY